MSDEEEAKKTEEQMLRFSSSYSAELRSKMSRLDELIADRHWLSVGGYKESLLRDLLRDHLPSRYEIGTGFVLALVDGVKRTSKQLDVLVWNSQEHAPFFRDGSFVVIPPEAVAAVIEVKSTLSYDTLHKGLANLDSLDVFRPLARPGTAIHKALFAYELHDELTFPDAVLRTIYSHYSASLSERVSWSSRNDQMWTLPWVDTVAVLGHGVASLVQWDLDGTRTPVYLAMDRVLGGHDDTFGYCATTLLVDLVTRKMRATMRHVHPGKASVIPSIQLEHMIGFIGMQSAPKATSKIGGLSGDILAHLLENEVLPKDP